MHNLRLWLASLRSGERGSSTWICSHLQLLIVDRDLGTEGAEDADLSLRKCISGPNPLIPGPRYFCANRAIVPTGAYGTATTHAPRYCQLSIIYRSEKFDTSQSRGDRRGQRR
jgi:hypothetical protein